MIDERTERDVYFPEGDWIDFWNRSRTIRSPKTVRETVPLAKFPVFIRKGATFAFPLQK